MYIIEFYEKRDSQRLIPKRYRAAKSATCKIHRTAMKDQQAAGTHLQLV